MVIIHLIVIAFNPTRTELLFLLLVLLPVMWGQGGGGGELRKPSLFNLRPVHNNVLGLLNIKVEFD